MSSEANQVFLQKFSLPQHTNHPFSSNMSSSTPANRSWDLVQPSDVSLRTSNPIRNIIQSIDTSDINPEKSMIPLSIGDPTVFGNLKVDESINDALIENVQSQKFNGYQNSCGVEEARKAIAGKFCGADFSFENVFICSGCSGALDIAMGALLSQGDNILIPKPGFSLYQTLAKSKGMEVKFYNLLPEKQWEADLQHMESLIDDRTRAILVNNPSNPCGSVYSKEHLKAIVKLAERYCLPIIADEIYGEITFGDNTFYPLHEISETVPVLSVGGLAKQYLVPGWRVGWIIMHDRQDIFKKVDMKGALFRLTTLIIGANTLVQSVIPHILENTPLQFYTSLNQTLSENAQYCADRISKIPGLHPIQPQGAMYIMVQIKVNEDIPNDLVFTQKLLKEQSVFVLPGKCFGAENFMRIVFCPPKETLKVAFDRMEEFCKKHFTAQ